MLCLVTALGVQAQEGVRFFEGTLEEALQEARAQKKMLFIDAYTSWCGLCKWMSESEFKKPEAGAFFNRHFVNYKINVEKGRRTGADSMARSRRSTSSMVRL